MLQDYPRHRLQIIIVDDQSTDDTLKQIQSFSKEHSILILQNSSQGKYISSKKTALELAVSKARGEILLFTDADCRPGPRWVNRMVSHFDESTGLVAGFSPQTAANAFWNDLLKIDAAAAAFVAAATIALGRGVTCTGRNLAVKKQALSDIGGYKALPDSLSGDDDFILQKMSQHPRWGVRYAMDPMGVVPADGPSNLFAFLKQKQRHLSAGKHFQFFSQFAYALFHLANLGIWVCPVLAIFGGLPCLAPFILKLLLDYCVIRWFLRQFHCSIKGTVFIVWEPLYLFYNIFAGPLSFIVKHDWKNYTDRKSGGD